MGHQNNISFDGMTPEAAKNLADGLASASARKLEGLFERAKEIQGLDEAGFARMKELAAAGNGGCFIGCSGA